MGRLEESYPLFRTIFRQDKNWRMLLPRLVPGGLIEDDAVKKSCVRWSRLDLAINCHIAEHM